MKPTRSKHGGFHVFKCVFDTGAVCEVKFSIKPPTPGLSQVPLQTWSGSERSDDIFPNYREWVKTVYQEMADFWDMNLALAIPPSRVCDRGELWLFRPGQSPYKPK